MINAETKVGRRALDKIANHKLLTAEEEQALARRVAEGDESAVQEIVLAHARFAITEANKYTGDSVCFEDAIQATFVAMMKAAKKFRPGYGRFITYAIWQIRAESQTQLRKSFYIPITAMGGQRSRRIKEAISDYRLSHGGGWPTPEWVAEATGASLNDAKRFMISTVPLRRMDDEVESPATGLCRSRHEIIGDNEHYWSRSPKDPLDNVLAERAMAVITSEKTRRVIRGRLWEDKSFEDIGREEGVSRQAVELRFRKGIAKMRKALEGERA